MTTIDTRRTWSGPEVGDLVLVRDAGPNPPLLVEQVPSDDRFVYTLRHPSTGTLIEAEIEDLIEIRDGVAIELDEAGEVSPLIGEIEQWLCRRSGAA